MGGFAARGCQKLNCKTGSYKLHRHHLASEKFFLDVLHGKYRTQRWYQVMVENYYSFRPRDTVSICEPHHAEIHHRYNKLVGKYIRANGPPQNWTKQVAENLMSLLRADGRRWLRTETLGLRGGFKELVAIRAKEKPTKK